MTDADDASSAAPTTSLGVVAAGQQITRDNYHWGTTLGVSPGTITFGFRASDATYNYGDNGTFTQFTSQEMAAAETALRLWSEVANITFSEVSAGSYTNNATILFGNYYSSTDQSQAFAYFPSSNGQGVTSAQGDVWVNRYYENIISLPFGSYDFITLLHEIGHTLGLEHPGDYNAGPGVSITYNNSAAYIEDSREYTVMSYFAASNTGANHTYNGVTYYASTPLLDDIAALQRLYGANTNYATGSTVYGFNSNADAAFHLTSSAQQDICCVWDGGGTDTFDFSGYSNNQVINLNAGTFSNTGALTDNWSIALGTVIENAIGGSGNDTIYGNSANNVTDGRAGTDTYVLTGAHSVYQITNSGGALQLVDLRSGSPDGTDLVSNVEFFSFSDGMFTAAQLISPSVAVESLGSISLVQWGSNYYLFPVGGSSGPVLSYLGAPVVAGGSGGWSPIGAEATSTGYEVAWKLAGADQYQVWATDSSGKYITNLVGAVSGSDLSLKSIEVSFHQDLNGDGTIGAPAVTAEALGSTSLVQVGINYYVYPVGGSSGPVLSYLGAPVVAGGSGGWSPIGAEATSTGYEVAWKLAGADQYQVWATDSSGKYITNLVGAVSGSDLSLKSIEVSFHQDLNGDGTIGAPAVTAEALGSTSLVQVGINYYVYPVGGSSGPVLSYLGAPVVAGGSGGWSPIGAEATSTGYEVAWKLAGADQYQVWATDSSGKYITNLVGAVSGSDLSLKSIEVSFHQDLNGDGTIGAPAVTAEALGSTSLVQVGINYYVYPVGGSSGPVLSYLGAPVVAGGSGGWSPIGAEATSTGYEVAWKLAGADQYQVWATDSSGKYITNLVGAVSGSDLSLKSIEVSFHQDLNGDGTIGAPAVTAEALGSTSLVQVGINSVAYLDNIVSVVWGSDFSLKPIEVSFHQDIGRGGTIGTNMVTSNTDSFVFASHFTAIPVVDLIDNSLDQSERLGQTNKFSTIHDDSNVQATIDTLAINHLIMAQHYVGGA